MIIRKRATQRKALASQPRVPQKHIVERRQTLHYASAFPPLCVSLSSTMRFRAHQNLDVGGAINGQSELLLNLLPFVVLRGIDSKKDFVGFVLLFLRAFFGKDVNQLVTLVFCEKLCHLGHVLCFVSFV